MGCAELMGMIFLVLFLQTCAWEEQKKGFGEECLTTQECHEKELLQCLNGLCVCSPFVSMVYDEIAQKCVSRVGEKCGVSTRGEYTVTIPCVEGAICDESIGGGCVCTDDYFRIANGTCLKKRKYLESCRGDFECSKDLRTSKPLVCSDDKNVCICNPATQFYDNERKQCVTLVGKECAIELANYLNECTDNAACVNGTCQCQEHYAPTRNGRCGLGYGETCTGAGNRNKQKTCSDLQLVCLNGKCDCRYQLHQYYDEGSRECISLISGPCTVMRNETEEAVYFGTEPTSSSSTTDATTTAISTTTPDPPAVAASTSAALVSLPPQRCTKNAVCIDRGFFTSCECEDGYVQTKAGKCAPGHGSPCEVDECDPITPLFCRNGICSCSDELQVFDASMRKCVGLVGSRCDLNLEYQCVEFCSCIQIGLHVEGKCLCDKYSKEVSNRTCVYLQR